MTDAEPRETPALPLDLSPEETAALLSRINEAAVSFLADLPRQPAFATESAARVARRLDEPPPEEGLAIDRILELLADEVLPCALNTASSGYFAYVPGGGLVSAAAADMLAQITNRYAGVWAAAPGAVELETTVLRWLARLIGMPEGSLGVLTTGGSMSNLIAVVAAREKLLGRAIDRGTAYVSTEVHGCVDKALRIAGIPEERLRRVPVDAAMRLSPGALRDRVREDRAAGLHPFLVVGSAGTVNTGAIDPLQEIAAIAREEGLWFHVDGAYGGAFRLVPELADRFAGIEAADSVALDPHKGFFLAYGTGALLVRDLETLRAAHAGGGAYLPEMQDGARHLDFCDLTPELSRDWRGLRLWLPFKLHGVSAFRRALGERRRLALEAYDAVSRREGLVTSGPPELTLFAFRCDPRGRSREEANAATRSLRERMCAGRRFLLTGTVIDGIEWIRICVLHLRTRDADVDAVIQALDASL